MCSTQHSHFVEVPANQLQSNGKPFRMHGTRHGQRRVTCHVEEAVKGRKTETSNSSRQNVSTQKARHGFRSCIQSAAHGISPCCFQTRHGPTNWGRRLTGSSSSTRQTIRLKIKAQLSPRQRARSKASGLYEDANRNVWLGCTKVRPPRKACGGPDHSSEAMPR